MSNEPLTDATVTRRQRLVEDAMRGLDDVAQASLAEQLDRLTEAQTLIAAALNNDPGQAGIPGVDRQ